MTKRPDAVPPKEVDEKSGLREAVEQLRRDFNTPEEVMQNDSPEHRTTGVHMNGAPSVEPPTECPKCGLVWREVLCEQCMAALLPIAASPSGAAQPLPDGWVSCPSIQYAGREYAIVWQRDRPFLCCRINGRWMVEHVIGHPEDAAREDGGS